MRQPLSLRRELQPTYRIAMHCMDWHGGQWSGLYSVGSCLLGNHPVDGEQLERARQEAKEELERAKALSDFKAISDLSILTMQLGTLQ